MRDVYLWNGDSLTVLPTLPSASVDAVVTDPPYELGFMGKGWDASGIAYSVGLWREVLRVLKPGGHLLAFGGTRTYHRMACAIEDAGFEIRDSLHWIYGSGFPKSLDVSKAIDKAAGVSFDAEPAHGVGFMTPNGEGGYNATKNRLTRAGESTDAARRWDGWGTALKPAHEPIVVARKPLEGTVAANVQKWGTGALNIDGCRILRAGSDVSGWSQTGSAASENRAMSGANYARQPKPDAEGRWPPNILLSHTPECGETCAESCPVAEIDRQSGFSRSPPVGSVAVKVARVGQVAKGDEAARISPNGHGDSGGASRFFPVFRYQAKASRSERDAGLDELPSRTGAEAVERKEGSGRLSNPRAGAGRSAGSVRNHHPTVKPVSLMRWLVRLVTPPGGVVLDPFMGSGTTGVAARKEGFAFVGVERENEYFRICEARIGGAKVDAPRQKELFA